VVLVVPVVFACLHFFVVVVVAVAMSELMLPKLKTMAISNIKLLQSSTIKGLLLLL
jgi:hypothetical protein